MTIRYVLTGDPTLMLLSKFVESLKGMATVQIVPHFASDDSDEPTAMPLSVSELTSTLMASVGGETDPMLNLSSAVRVANPGAAIAILAVRAANKPLGPDEVLGVELLGRPPGLHLVLDEGGQFVS